MGVRDHEEGSRVGARGDAAPGVVRVADVEGLGGERVGLHLHVRAGHPVAGAGRTGSPGVPPGEPKAIVTPKPEVFPAPESRSLLTWKAKKNYQGLMAIEENSPCEFGASFSAR